MSKHKKKHSKKAKAVVPDDIFAAAAQSVKRFRKVTNEIAKLSLGQKLVGSLVLVAAGLIYLDQRKPDDDRPRPASRFNWPRLPEAPETAGVQEAEVEPARAPAALKSPKPRKHHSSAPRKPLNDADNG
ncbi:hypothetical protein SAMN06265337_3260 [Hymenobacter gelipurpurascens]|uniref:Uncharacterized protein n=1 Tax=Hymenobacter gelipurpurascens TaxID=89968 RepID=A0A212UDL5_9BACT|nr:hypothetical protein [Hymenobacter gelipurpurascens]SNC76191.1 hypothetical protein SAMN06265337_3260 [Hymenobacter gelipurpurascens]